MQWRGVRRRYQTCTLWTPGQRASRVCSRSRSKVTWYGHFLGFLEWATPSLTVWFFSCIQFRAKLYCPQSWLSSHTPLRLQHRKMPRVRRCLCPDVESGMGLVHLDRQLRSLQWVVSHKNGLRCDRALLVIAVQSDRLTTSGNFSLSHAEKL